MDESIYTSRRRTSLGPFLPQRGGSAPPDSYVSPILRDRLQALLAQILPAYDPDRMADPRVAAPTIDMSRNLPQWQQPRTAAFDRMMPPRPGTAGGQLPDDLRFQNPTAPDFRPQTPDDMLALPQNTPTAVTPGFNPSAPVANVATARLRALAGFPASGPEMGGSRMRAPQELRPSTPDDMLAAVQSATPPEAPSIPHRSALSDFLGRNPDLPDGLLVAGLGAMAAGGRPGATTLGALGEGGLAAVREMSNRRRMDIQDRQVARQIRQGDERLDIERAKLKSETENRILQLRQQAANAAATLEERREAHQNANELKRLMMEANTGNRRAMLELQENLAAEKAEARLDEAASKAYHDIMRRLTTKDVVTGAEVVSPDAERKAEDHVLRAFPKSALGQSIAAAREADDAAIPAKAIEYLRKNPTAADQFDQKYGAGMARRVLGK